MRFEPPLLPVHTVLAALAAVLAVVGLAWWSSREASLPRRVALAGVRAAAAAALALILLNPVSSPGDRREQGRRPFILLLDTSRSMCTPDTGAGSRYQAALRLTVQNRALMAEIARRHDLRLFGFAERPEPASAEALASLARPSGARTRLGEALTGAIAAVAPYRQGGHILLVSDGRDTGDSFPVEAARAARAAGLRVSTLCVGRSTGTRDLQVIARRPQVFAAPGQTVELGVEVRVDGLNGGTVRADLTRGGRRIASRAVSLTPGRHEVVFPVRETRKGLHRWAVMVPPVPGEASSANNRAAVFLNVMDSRARVLLLEGRPSWDAKFLAQALREDSTIALDVIYKLTDTKFTAVIDGGERESGIAVPTTVEQLSAYDVLILGKGFEEFYDAAGARTLKQWVSERGGCLLLLRGRPDERTEALRELEPVTWSDSEIRDLRLRLTQEGRSHPGFTFAVSEDAQTVVRRLPALITATRVQGEKAMAVVLARSEAAASDQVAEEMATVAWQRFGQGKVMAVAGQGLWQWAFLPPDLQSYRPVYREFWTQTVHWMVSESDFLPGQRIAVRPERSICAPGETITLLGYARSGAPIPPAVQVSQPDGRMIRVATSRADGRRADFTATFRAVQPGEHLATVVGGGQRAPAHCIFTVLPAQEEDLNRSADPGLMRQIAAAGGGEALTPGRLSDLPRRLAVGEADRVRRSESRPAWDRPWVLAVLASLLCAEWILRRRSGLA